MIICLATGAAGNAGACNPQKDFAANVDCDLSPAGLARAMVPSNHLVPLLGILLLWFGFGLVGAEENGVREKNVIIIGASSLAPPLHEWVRAMVVANKTPMAVEPGFFATKDFERRWSARGVWDYVIMDAWQFKRGSTEAPGFPDAVSAFVKQARDHSPECKVILFPWWIPSGREATNEGVMTVFHRCVEAARPNGIWVATTGPAFMEARLSRADLRITVSPQDAHPGVHGVYINACSLFAILTGASPVGLPASLKFRGTEIVIAPDDARFLQELAWKIYQREIKHTKPGK